MTSKADLSKRGLFLSVSLASGVALVLAVQAAADQFLSSPLFLVREVEVTWPKGVGGQPERFRLSPATSIFRVDLAALGRAFHERYPSIEVQEIRRFLPNRLAARMRFRKVVAQIKQGVRYFAVGDDGTIVAEGQTEPLGGLPILELERRPGRLRAGDSIVATDFWKVAALLTTLERAGGIAGRPVGVVRVEGPDLILLLDSGLEIRFASDRLAGGWQRLAELIVSKREVLQNAAYLDLRFGDPVIRERSRKRGRR